MILIKIIIKLAYIIKRSTHYFKNLWIHLELKVKDLPLILLILSILIGSILIPSILNKSDENKKIEYIPENLSDSVQSSTSTNKNISTEALARRSVAISKTQLGDVPPIPKLMFQDNHKISTISFSYDGKYIVTGNVGGSYKIIETGTGAIFGEINKQSLSQNALFRPKTFDIAISQENQVHLWNPFFGVNITEFPKVHDATIEKMCFNVEGSKLATVDSNKQIILWDIEKKIGEKIHYEMPEMPDYYRYIRHLSFVKNDEAILIVFGKTIIIHQLDQTQNDIVINMSDYGGWINDVVVKRSTMNVFLLTDNHQIYDLNVSNGKISFFGDVNFAHNLAISPDGSTFATGTDGFRDTYVHFWSADNCELLRTLFTGKNGIEDLDFSPDGRTLASAEFERLSIWTVDSHDVSIPPIRLWGYDCVCYDGLKNCDSFIIAGTKNTEVVLHQIRLVIEESSPFEPFDPGPLGLLSKTDLKVTLNPKKKEYSLLKDKRIYKTGEAEEFVVEQISEVDYYYYKYHYELDWSEVLGVNSGTIRTQSDGVLFFYSH